MPAPIDFYFDFSSPYGYLASLRIDELAARHGRDVTWRPYLMGAAMKRTGSQPLVHRPLVADYARRDIPRSARRIGAPFTLPDPFPVATVAAGRAFYRLHDHDPGVARRFAADVYRAYFVEGRNIGEAAVVLDVAAAGGADRDTLAAALQDPEVKQRLRAETDAAMGRGVFGSPWFIVDGEPFWGNDRIDDVAHWLESGGW